MSAAYTEAIETFLNAKCSLLRDKTTWRGWLADVLVTLNKEGEGFSGKRPNCDSGWEWTLAREMHRAGLSCGTTNQEDKPFDVNEEDGNGDDFDVDWYEQKKHFEAVINHIFGCVK